MVDILVDICYCQFLFPEVNLNTFLCHFTWLSAVFSAHADHYTTFCPFKKLLPLFSTNHKDSAHWSWLPQVRK